VLVAPWRKNLAFTFRSRVGSGNLHDIRYAKRPQLANLPRACILVGESARMNSSPLHWRVGKNRNSRRDAALHEVRRFERPAPPESSDMTMMSAGATGSSTTSAHPAARRTGSDGGTATMAAATNASTIVAPSPISAPERNARHHSASSVILTSSERATAALRELEDNLLDLLASDAHCYGCSSGLSGEF